MKIFLLSRRQLLPLLLVPFLLLTSLWAEESPTGPLSGKVIVIDAGHGGIDSGANRPGISEKDINLAISLRLGERLSRQGAKVILSRQEDTSLGGSSQPSTYSRYQRDLLARVKLSAEVDAAAFVSIHANAAVTPRRRGVEIFYHRQSEAGKRLAECLYLPLSTLAAGSRLPAAADFFVLRRNAAPAVLIETGYITNPEERQQLTSDSYQRQLAQAITDGLVAYFGGIDRGQ